MTILKFKEQTSIERPNDIGTCCDMQSRQFREAANGLNLDGFKVTRFEVLEDPSTAMIDVESAVGSTQPGESILAKFVKLANAAFDGLNFDFFVVMTLTDYTKTAGGIEVIYTIKRNEAVNHEPEDEVSIAISNKTKPRFAPVANEGSFSEAVLHRAV